MNVNRSSTALMFAVGYESGKIVTYKSPDDVKSEADAVVETKRRSRSFVAATTPAPSEGTEKDGG